jgi:hypothetical protein
MFTFLGRGLCGALILLVTLANGGHSFPNTDNTEPASPPSPMRAGASSLDSALAQPPVEYQQKPANVLLPQTFRLAPDCISRR